MEPWPILTSLRRLSLTILPVEAGVISIFGNGLGSELISINIYRLLCISLTHSSYI